mgnify:CR=1 FL=1
MRDVPINDILKAGHLLFWYYFFTYLNFCTCLIWTYLLLPVVNYYLHDLNKPGGWSDYTGPYSYKDY